MKYLKLKTLLLGTIFIFNAVQAGENSLSTFLQAADVSLKILQEVKSRAQGVSSRIPTFTDLLTKEEKTLEQSTIPPMVTDFIQSIEHSSKIADYAEEITPQKSYNNILLYGPPGTGKTVLTKYIANETYKKFINISPAQLMKPSSSLTLEDIACISLNDRFIGYFLPTYNDDVLIIDEIDMIGENRNNHTNDNKKSILIQLLILIDKIKSYKLPIIIAATTNIEDLDFFDGALLDRFPWQCHVENPTLENKEKIFKFGVTIMTEKELALLKHAVNDRRLNVNNEAYIYIKSQTADINYLLEQDMNVAIKDNPAEKRKLPLKMLFRYLSPRQIQQLIESAYNERNKENTSYTPLHKLIHKNQLSEKLFTSIYPFTQLITLITLGRCGEKLGKTVGIIIFLVETTALPKLLARSPRLQEMIQKLEKKHAGLSKFLWLLNGLGTIWYMSQLLTPRLDKDKVQEYLKKRIPTKNHFQQALDAMKIKVPQENT